MVNWQIETIDTSTVVHGIAKDQNKYLLTKEKNDRWHIPSGRLKRGESPADAIIREVREETGAKCVPVGIFKLYHGFLMTNNKAKGEVQINRVHYFFEIKIISAIIDKPNEHTNGAGWFTREEIERLPIRTPKIFPHFDDFEQCKLKKSILPMEFFVTKI